MTIRDVASGDEQEDVRNEWQSWTWSLTLPAGSYEVLVHATDHAGNTSEAQVVCFGVGEPGCGIEGGSESGADGSSGGPSGGTGDDETGGEGGSASGTTGAPASTSGGNASSADGDGSSSGAASGSGGGGGCSVGGGTGALALLLLGVIAPLRRRR